jgi:hypothetical protein
MIHNISIRSYSSPRNFRCSQLRTFRSAVRPAAPHAVSLTHTPPPPHTSYQEAFVQLLRKFICMNIYNQKASQLNLASPTRCSHGPRWGVLASFHFMLFYPASSSSPFPDPEAGLIQSNNTGWTRRFPSLRHAPSSLERLCRSKLRSCRIRSDGDCS